MYWVPIHSSHKIIFKQILHLILTPPLFSYAAMANSATFSEFESQFPPWENIILSRSILASVLFLRLCVLYYYGDLRKGSDENQQAQLFLGSDRMGWARWASFSCFGTLRPWGCRKIGWLVLNSCNLALVLEVMVFRQCGGNVFIYHCLWSALPPSLQFVLPKAVGVLRRSTVFLQRWSGSSQPELDVKSFWSGEEVKGGRTHIVLRIYPVWFPVR